MTLHVLRERARSPRERARDVCWKKKGVLDRGCERERMNWYRQKMSPPCERCRLLPSPLQPRNWYSQLKDLPQALWLPTRNAHIFTGFSKQLLLRMHANSAMRS